MYKVTSRQVTTTVIELSIDRELARNLARLIEKHHETNDSRSGTFFDFVKDLGFDPKIRYELERLASSIRGHL
jgi:hypothetical protein